MKKAIGNLTLNEVADICKKCDESKIGYCPFNDVLFLKCFCNNDEERRIGFDKEIEVLE